VPGCCCCCRAMLLLCSCTTVALLWPTLRWKLCPYWPAGTPVVADMVGSEGARVAVNRLCPACNCSYGSRQDTIKYEIQDSSGNMLAICITLLQVRHTAVSQTCDKARNTPTNC
jgi:hypothetical protein